MISAGVPCVPGWHPSSTSDPSTQLPEFLILEADKIGYPVLIKAVSGGGGKGMKIVEKREEFVGQLESAKREAIKGFGDDTVSCFLSQQGVPSSTTAAISIGYLI